LVIASLIPKNPTITSPFSPVVTSVVISNEFGGLNGFDCVMHLPVCCSDMMMQIVEDHPNCIIFPPNKFRPLPGTELYNVAEKEWGYNMPNTLEAWSNIEVEGEVSDQWYEEGMAKFCNLMLISSYFIDNKVAKVTQGKTLFYKLIRAINFLYRPIACFRLRHGLSGFLVEYWAYRTLTGTFARLQARMTNVAPPA